MAIGANAHIFCQYKLCCWTKKKKDCCSLTAVEIKNAGKTIRVASKRQRLTTFRGVRRCTGLLTDKKLKGRPPLMVSWLGECPKCYLFCQRRSIYSLFLGWRTIFSFFIFRKYCSLILLFPISFTQPLWKIPGKCHLFFFFLSFSQLIFPPVSLDHISIKNFVSSSTCLLLRLHFVYVPCSNIQSKKFQFPHWTRTKPRFWYRPRPWGIHLF